MEVACVLGKVEGGGGQVAAFQDMGWLELGTKVECPSQGHASLPLLGNLCPPGTPAASGEPARRTPGLRGAAPALTFPS